MAFGIYFDWQRRIFMTHISDIQRISDLSLVDKYKTTKDVNYVGELFKRYTSVVFAISIKYLKNKDAAGDAVIEIFEKLLNDLLRFEIENFPAWLHKVTRNHCLITIRSGNYQKKHMDRYTQDMNSFMEKDSVVYHESEINKEENLVMLEKGIQNLNHEQKKCIDLFYLKEKCYNEIAKETGYSLNEVKSYIQNGKRNLKIFMEKNQQISDNLIKILLMILLFNQII